MGMTAEEALAWAVRAKLRDLKEWAEQVLTQDQSVSFRLKRTQSKCVCVFSIRTRRTLMPIQRREDWQRLLKLHWNNKECEKLVQALHYSGNQPVQVERRTVRVINNRLYNEPLLFRLRTAEWGGELYHFVVIPE